MPLKSRVSEASELVSTKNPFAKTRLPPSRFFIQPEMGRRQAEYGFGEYGFKHRTQ